MRKRCSPPPASSSVALRPTSRPRSGGSIEPLSQREFVRLVQQGSPIEDADLSGIDWHDVPVGALTARRCRIANTTLRDAELSDARFDHCIFVQTRFAGCDLSGATLTHCSFFDADTRQGCDLSFVNLQGSTLEDCNLSTCKFGSAELHAVRIMGCKASGADFELASFSRKLGRAVTTAGAVTGCMLDIASFRDVILTGCNLSRSSLRGADFSGANLAEAAMRGCELSGANVAGARLDSADVREAVLDDVDLGSARSYVGIKVSHSQLPALARKLGIRVFPD